MFTLKAIPSDPMTQEEMEYQNRYISEFLDDMGEYEITESEEI